MSSEKKHGNAQLRDFYDKIYREGEENFFSKFKKGVDSSETNDSVLGLLDWRDRTVLDVGCGTGGLLREIAARGAKRVTGIDYSNEAIEIAREKNTSSSATYIAGNVTETDLDVHDVVLSCGTIEHSDDPASFLGTLGDRCAADGSIIITCPHFINVRGFVWMALAELLDVPMSLTDLHFIHPWHVDAWCETHGFRVVRFLTCDHARGNGGDLLADFEKRLTNALRDAGLNNAKVPAYMDYLERLVGYLGGESSCRLQGATAVYQIDKASSIEPAPAQ
ncbi:MAG: class I SAM-dependent methyltransferase [Proteobacteria bacterium]|nr:MAG: class I SAM-dependent methyltransferase [Pseudomonadota bacterium]